MVAPPLPLLGVVAGEQRGFSPSGRDTIITTSRLVGGNSILMYRLSTYTIRLSWIGKRGRRPLMGALRGSLRVIYEA